MPEKQQPVYNPGEVVIFREKVFTSKSYTPYYDAYKGHAFKIVALHFEDEEQEEDWEAHVELECITGDVKVKGHVHQDEIRHKPVEICDWTAFEAIKHIGVIPMSIEVAKGETPRPPSDAEIRRWLDQGAVVINGAKPKAKDIVRFPINQLIFFPKSEKRRTTVI